MQQTASNVANRQLFFNHEMEARELLEEERAKIPKGLTLQKRMNETSKARGRVYTTLRRRYKEEYNTLREIALQEGYSSTGYV